MQKPTMTMIEVIVNDRMGNKIRVKCEYTCLIITMKLSPRDTIKDLKMLVAAHIGTRPEKIRLQKAHVVYKDHISLDDYEIKDGTGLEMYYN